MAQTLADLTPQQIADLQALSAAGLTSEQVQALGSGGAAPSTQATTTGAVDSLGIPVNSAAGTALIPSLPANATPAQEEAAAMSYYSAHPEVAAQIQATYGYIGTYLMSIPELEPILIAAGLEGWGQGQLDAAVVQTNWWKNTSSAQRNFGQLQATNPGEAAQQVAQMQDTVLNTAQSLGITVPPDSLKGFAQMAVTFNWSSDVITQAIRQNFSAATAAPAFGQSATFADQARTLAGAYGINLDPASLAKYVQQNQQGTLTADGLQSIFVQQAKSSYSWMAPALDQGVTVSQYLSNYASGAATTLDIDPSDVNWTDPKWTKALLTNPDGTSAPAPVNVGVFQQNLMKDPSYGYQNTKGARDQAYGVANQILQTFGKVA